MSIATEITRINNAKLAIRNTLNIPNTDKLDTYGFYLDGINSPFSPPKIVAKDYSTYGNLYRLQDAKNNLKEGLKDNGVDVSDNALIDTYNGLISQCRVPGGTLRWETIEGSLPVNSNSFNRQNLWTDGTNVYYSTGSTQLELVIDSQGRMQWSPRSWTATQGGSVSLDGNYIWTDNTDIYYTNGSTSFILNKDTMTWDRITFNQSVAGDSIWTDGTNIYYSNSNRQFIFDKETKQWSTMTWNGYSVIFGFYVWTDGTDIYYSPNSSTTYILDRSTNTWESSSVTGAYGNSIRTDGKNIYGGVSLSVTNFNRIFNISTKTWTSVTNWGFFHKFFTLNPNKQVSCQCRCNTFGQDRCLRAVDILMPNSASSSDYNIYHGIRQFS